MILKRTNEDSVIHCDTVHLEKKNKHETDLANQFNSLIEELITKPKPK